MNWAWIASNASAIVGATWDHLVLTVIAVGVGFALSLGFALIIRDDRRFEGPINGLTGILYTIPSLALFALLVPITGLSLLTAEIGLVSYTLLILTRHIVAGFDAVPRDIVESADGMGFTARQRLIRIDLPLAIPLILAGLRVATVTTIGLVMVTALIGEGGLGNLMLRGFNFRNYTAVYVGAIVTVALAVVADALILAIGRLLTPWTRSR
ncbi:MAG TPA: ABC transporter permease [Candidatus Limnocylindrales bacterium]|nr:ABC transporter permease [Candidatus Limnocylindrales bacterium]